jgi:hypothetical protein
MLNGEIEYVGRGLQTAPIQQSAFSNQHFQDRTYA